MADQNFQLLLVEDDTDLREAICTTLKMGRFPHIAVESAEDALGVLDDATVQLLVTDFRLPGMNGLELLEQAAKRRHDLPVVVMTAFADTQLAVRALKLGAKDFLIKPFLPQQLLEIVQRYQPRASGTDTQNSPNIIAVDPATIAALKRCERSAGTDASVLLLGESGVGKDVFARRVHQLSNRRTKPFVAINCAAIPETLLESTLFGFERGAFTGANRSQQGKFEQAHEGTLFLDEVGDMSLKTQAKVLRALQEQVIEPVGGHASVRVDVRVIAATNKDLVEGIRAGQFREDLYFRLNVIPIHVPPLRDRGEDVFRLAEHFIAEFAREYGRRPKQFRADALRTLQSYPWPGNVRELRNVIERLMIMVAGDVIVAADLSFLDAPTGPLPPPVVPGDVRPLYSARETWEREYILGALAAFEGNISRTADTLGVERSNLYRKMRSLGIAGGKKEEEP